MFLEMSTLLLGPDWQEVQVPMYIQGEITLFRELDGTRIQRVCMCVCGGGGCLEFVYMCVRVFCLQIFLLSKSLGSESEL